MFPLAAFLRILEQDGFRLTIRDYDRIALVLSTDGDWTRIRLRSVLRTLLARNRDQQDLFERRFDEFFADLPDEPVTNRAVNLEAVQAELARLKSRVKKLGAGGQTGSYRRPFRFNFWSFLGIMAVYLEPVQREFARLRSRIKKVFFASRSFLDGLLLLMVAYFKFIQAALKHLGSPSVRSTSGDERPQQPKTEKKVVRVWYVFFLCVLLSVLAVVFWPGPPHEDAFKPKSSPAEEVVQSESKADLNNLPQYIIHPQKPVIATRESSPVIGKNAWKESALIAGLLLLLFLAYALYLYRAQKVSKDKPAHWEKNPALPRLFPLDRVGGKPRPRLDRETLAHLADSLGYFLGDRPDREPDIIDSVIATMDNGGLPTLVFPYKKQLRRLIILVNQADQEALRLNPVADELYIGMQRLGVQLLAGRYYNDPAIFYPQDGRARFLADYESGRNGYLLLIFSNDGEVDAVRHGHTLEELARWPHIAWMQLRTNRFQHDSTVSSSYGIVSYPASKAGLLAAFTRFLTEIASFRDTCLATRKESLLRGDADLSTLLEIRLGDALPWAQACSKIQPTPLGLADCLRREFFVHLAPERIERFMALPGTTLGKGSFSFSPSVLAVLQQGFLARLGDARQTEISERILAELETTWDAEFGGQSGAEHSLARLAWQKQFQLVNLQLEPDQALKGLAELEGTPLHNTLKADLEKIIQATLRKTPVTKEGRQRLARLLGKRSGIPLLQRYPLNRWQWTGAVILMLSLLATSGWSLSRWLAIDPGKIRLSVLAEHGGGSGWIGVEESGSKPQKHSGSEGLLRLPLETKLPLGKNWQLVFYDYNLQPVHAMELDRINENQLIQLTYEVASENQGKNGELVLTDQQKHVLNDTVATLRSSLFTVTAPADHTLVLPVGEYEVRLIIGVAWQRVTVAERERTVVELESPYIDPTTGMKFVYVPADCFIIGGYPESGKKYNSEVSMHKVCVDGFWMGKYEVTQREWQKIMGENPAFFKKGDNYPAEEIAWTDT